MTGQENDAADGGFICNVYDKYGTKNPVARWLMNGFLETVSMFYRRTCARSVLEVGCGEGRLADHLIRQSPPTTRFVATDVALDHVASDLDSRLQFEVASVYELPYEADSFDLVICCEVLEHLERPLEAMREIARVAKHHVIMSTPREPVWRALNMARGQYLRELGNTPGHINHWGRKQLVELAETQLHRVRVQTPLPWTILVGRPGGPR